MKTLFIVMSLLAPAMSGFAQQAANSPPEMPLLKRAPVPSQWTITFKSNTGNGGKVITVIREANATVERIATAGGGAVETWHLPGGGVVMSAGGKSWQFLAEGQNTFDSTDYSNSDFAGFDWISQANFAGKKDAMGMHCLVFADSVLTVDPREIAASQSLKMAEYGDLLEALKIAREAKGKSGDAAAPTPPPPVFDAEKHKVKVTAYIDEKTRLPVMLTTGTGTAETARIYQFQPAPPLLSMPPEAQKVLDNQKARQQRLSKPIAPI